MNLAGYTPVLRRCSTEDSARLGEPDHSDEGGEGVRVRRLFSTYFRCIGHRLLWYSGRGWAECNLPPYRASR